MGQLPKVGMGGSACRQFKECDCGGVWACAQRPLPDASRSGMRGLDHRHAGTHCHARCKVHIDCQGTIDCLIGGKLAGCSVANARAHLWGSFYNSFGGQNALQPLRPKRTPPLKMSERTTLREKKGSDQADKLAKLGAKMHPWSEGALDTHAACRQVVKEVGGWAAQREMWRGGRGMRDAMSMAEPPLRNLP